jgi:hypothetical protein
VIIAYERSSAYGELLGSVRGAIFFGVPHRGADVAYWGNVVANICKLTPFGSNTKFIAPLRRKSGMFAEISQRFVERCKPLQICTFHETKTVKRQLVRAPYEPGRAYTLLTLPDRLWTKTRPVWASQARLSWGSRAPTIGISADLRTLVVRNMSRLRTHCKNWWSLQRKVTLLVR